VTTVIKGAQTAVQPAKAAGLMRTATDRLLDRQGQS
jgi:hypothetical protein